MSRFLLCFSAIVVLSFPVFGQAAVEAALGSAAASTGTAGGMGGLNKSFGDLFKKLNETLKTPGVATEVTPVAPAAAPRKGKASARKTAAPVPAPVPAPAPGVESPAPVYEDAALIQKGIAYDELVRRFGPPAIQVTNIGGSHTMTYMSHGRVLQVEMQGGKVVVINATS